MQTESICRALTWIGLLATAGIVGAALPAAEIKRLEEIVSRETVLTQGRGDAPDFDAIVRRNGEIIRAARRACHDAINGRAYSVLKVALDNPEMEIWGEAIVGLTRVPPESRKPLLIPALLNPPWPPQGDEGAKPTHRSSLQGTLSSMISRALGEEVKFDHYWSAEERGALVERLHAQLGLPIPPGQFTVPSKGPTHSKVRLPSPAAGVGANPGIGEPGGLLGAAAPITQETGGKSWLFDCYLVAAIGSLVAAMAVWFFLRSRHSRLVQKKRVPAK